MIVDGRIYGLPLVQYADTKANVEALTLVAGDEGAIAFATDTHELGRFDGAAWHWLPEAVPFYYIVLYSGGVTAYDVDDAGMAAAIAAAGAGDTIWIPPVTLANDYTVPADVTVVGESIHDVVFSGQITLNSGSVLERLSVTRSKNDGADYYGVVGPNSGIGYIHNCRISVTQVGAGDGYGINVEDLAGQVRVYQGYVYGSTADALTNEGGALLKEDGDYLLLETGDHLLLEVLDEQLTFYATVLGNGVATNEYWGTTLDVDGNLRVSGQVYEGTP